MKYILQPVTQETKGKKYLSFNSHVPLVWCVNFPTLLVRTCVSECRKDLCDVHAVTSEESQSEKLEAGVRRGPFRMHMLTCQSSTALAAVRGAAKRSGVAHKRCPVHGAVIPVGLVPQPQLY